MSLASTSESDKLPVSDLSVLLDSILETAGGLRERLCVFGWLRERDCVSLERGGGGESEREGGERERFGWIDGLLHNPCIDHYF